MKSSQSLGLHLLQRAFSAYVVVAIIVTALQLWSEYEITRDRVNAEIHYQESVFTESLENGVWHLDATQIQSIVAGIIRSPVVSGVSIVDLDGKWIYQSGLLGDRLKPVEPANVLGETAPRFSFMRDEDLLHHSFSLFDRQPRMGGTPASAEKLAEAHFYLDHSVVVEEVKQSLLLIVLVAMAKTAALWLIFLFFIDRIVSRPLALLTQRSIDLSPDKPLDAAATTPIEIDQSETQELLHLKQTLNNLAVARTREEHYKQQLNALNEGLEQQVEERTAALNREHQSIKAIIESMDDGLVVLDQAGAIERINLKLEQMVGLPGHTLLGDPLNRLFQEGQSGEAFMQQLEQQKLHEQREMSCDDGKSLTVELLASPLYNEQQQMEGAVVVIHDLSERLKNEQRDRYAAYQSGISESGASVMHTIGNALMVVTAEASHLDRQVAVFEKITAALGSAQRAYADGKIEAEALHQIVTKISGVMEQIAGKEGEEAGVQENLSKLKHEIRHVGRLVHTFHSVSQMRFESTRFKLVDMVDDSLALIAATLEENEIGVTVDCSPSIELRLNRNATLQMLINLLNNSADAIESRRQSTPEYQGTVAIRVQQVENERIEVEIEDNGCGLDPALQDQILRSGFTTKVQGNGLNMHAVGNYVNKLGGSISFESEGENMGATIQLVLPMQFDESKK